MVNYLISAYSVNPYKGSEDSIGWNWVLQYEKNYKEGDRIILLTKKFNEKDTRRGLKEFNIQHVELVIVDVPNALNWFREKHSAFHHMYYILWQHWAWLWVKHSGIHFDVIHHVTMNDYRIPSELYKAKGAKVIWGPMGGAQVTPRPLKVYEKNQLVASLRETSGNVLLEAMAYAVPIVAFDTSFCRLLKEVDCGVFVNTDQALEGIKEDWCKAIVTLGQDKELAKQMGLNGYKYVNSKLTWDEKYRIIVNDM